MLKQNGKIKSFFSLVLLLLISVSLQASLPVDSSVALWLDASQTSTIVGDDGPLKNGDRVIGWNDILTASNTFADNATQPDPNKRPVYIASQSWANNYPVIRFNGTGTWLNSPSLNISDTTTIFIVSQAAPQAINAAVWNRPLLSADSGDPFVSLYSDGYGLSYSRPGVTSFVACLADYGYLMDKAQFNDLQYNFTFNVIALRRNADTLPPDGARLYIRNAADANFIQKSAVQFYQTGTLHTGYDIGGNPPEHGGMKERHYAGDIAEMIVYNKALTDIEFKQVNDYLYNKYVNPKVCGRLETVYRSGDLNKDCKIDLKDVAIFANDWMRCTNSTKIQCSADDYDWSIIAQNRWQTWRKSLTALPITSWAYFNRYLGSEKEYQVYANAGLNSVQAPIYHLEAASNAGLSSWMGSWESLADPNNTWKLKYYVNYPTPTDRRVNAYFLQDEPHTAAEFDPLGVATRYVYANDQRDAIPIVNLLPGYASYTGFADFNDYVRTYVTKVNPAILSYDHYPIMSDGTDRPTFYSDMETIRSNALRAGIGFMGFVSVTEYYKITPGYRSPSESDLNWMVYSLLSYGAKGITYYNYRIGNDPNFGEGLVTNADGLPTSTYPMVQAVNGEIRNIDQPLLSLQTQGVYHTSDTVPSGATAYSNGKVTGITNLTATNYLIGKFNDIDDATDNDVYIMLMNKRHGAGLSSASQSASATFTVNSSAYPYVYKYDPANGNLVLLSGSAGSYTVSLGGGKALLIRLSADTEP